MFFTDISYVVHPVGRITPTGISLLGTSFFINKPGILATASHVVGNNDNGLVIIMNRVNSIQDYQDTSNMQLLAQSKKAFGSMENVSNTLSTLSRFILAA